MCRFVYACVVRSMEDVSISFVFCIFAECFVTSQSESTLSGQCAFLSCSILLLSTNRDGGCGDLGARHWWRTNSARHRVSVKFLNPTPCTRTDMLSRMNRANWVLTVFLPLKPQCMLDNKPYLLNIWIRLMASSWVTLCTINDLSGFIHLNISVHVTRRVYVTWPVVQVADLLRELASNQFVLFVLFSHFG